MRTQGSDCLGTYLSFVAVCYWIRDQRKHSPRNRLNLRRFAGVQKGIRGTTESSPDIESDYEFSRRAGVTGTSRVHDGSQRGNGWGLKSFTNRRL